MVKMEFTIDDLMQKFNIDYQTAHGLARGLAAIGVLRVNGTRPNKTGRGKGATLYASSEGFGVDLEARFVAAWMARPIDIIDDDDPYGANISDDEEEEEVTT